MHKKHLVVLGASLSGYHTALELARTLRDHQVTVIARTENLLLRSSLVLVSFGLRGPDDVCVPVRPVLEAHGVRFLHDTAIRIDIDRQTVITRAGGCRYDYLVVASEAVPNYAAVPGLGPRRYTCSLTTLREAEQTRAAVDRLLEAPGPIVVGALHNDAGHAAAHDFLFTLAGQIRQRGLGNRAPIAYLTGTDGVGHLGTTGLASTSPVDEHLLANLGIRVVLRGVVREITPGLVHLLDGRSLPFRFAMLTPPFLGQEVIRACDRLTTPEGFVRVDDSFRSVIRPEVFAVGTAAATTTVTRAEPWDASRLAESLPAVSGIVAAAIAGDLHVGPADRPAAIASAS